MKGTNYIYASAKIRALESKILDETDIERMVDAPDFAGAFKVLNDTDYGDNLLDLDPTDYRLAIKRDFDQMHDLLQKITPKENLFELILLERDFINLKLFFKEKKYNIEIESHIRDNSIYSPDHLKDFIYETHIHEPSVMRAYVKEQKGQVLDQDIKNVIYRTTKKINEKTRPDEIDAILTQEYFDLKQELAKDIGSRFIINYVKMEIDVSNLLIWLRAKRLGLTKDILISKLIKGGQADIKKMIQLYPEEARGLKSFVNANFDYIILAAFEAFCENDNLFLLEKAIEDYKIRYARQAKRFSYGPEVIFGYYIAKQNAINNIRIILTGKLNKMPLESIKQTIREAY